MNRKNNKRKRRGPQRLITMVPKHLLVQIPDIPQAQPARAHIDFSGGAEGSQPIKIQESTTLYMIVAGDDQTPCRWNGRQLTIEWIDDNGVPLFTKEEATYVINYTYKFFESVGRTAHPILRAVPVFQLGNL